MNDPLHDPAHQPSERRLGKAAIWIVAIVIAMIVVVFVGMNMDHAQQKQQEETSGVKESTGGLH